MYVCKHVTRAELYWKNESNLLVLSFQINCMTFFFFFFFVLLFLLERTYRKLLVTPMERFFDAVTAK